MILPPDLAQDGDLAASGWQIIRNKPAIAAWAVSARPAAEAALKDPGKAAWYRYARTWFVGVDCLPNDADGRVEDGPPLPFDQLPGITPMPLHPGQISAVFPGYPQPMEGESPAATRFRLTRDAAHVDGLLPIGLARRRMLKDPHAWIVGVPLTDSDPAASPLVVWEASHQIIGQAFAKAFQGQPMSTWDSIDVTDTYQAARSHVLHTCKRLEINANPGDAVLIHRHMVHGIAPWTSCAATPRIMAYFRPRTTMEAWLKAD